MARKGSNQLRVTVLALVVAVLFWPPLANAQIASGVIRLCYDKWTPYAFDADGVAKGLAIDVVRLALEESAIDVNFEQAPTARCRLGLRHDRYDGILLAPKAAQDIRTPMIYSARPLVKYTLVAVVRASDPRRQYLGLSSFSGRRWLDVEYRNYPGTLLRDNSMISVPVAENANALDMLRKDYVDVAFSDLSQFQYANGEIENPVKLRVLMPPVFTQDNYLTLKAALAPVMKTYDSQITNMANTNRLVSLYEKHLGTSSAALAQLLTGLSVDTKP